MNNFSVFSYRKNITSQFGEDGIILKILELLNFNVSKACIEFGAHNGKHFSNTNNLILNYNFESIQIEQDQILFSDLKEYYKNHSKVICKSCFVSQDKESAYFLDTIVFNEWLSKEIFLISIDIDSYDFEIFEATNLTPYLFLIENNSHLTNRESQGVASLSKLAKEKNYRLISYTGNSFLLRNDILSEEVPEISVNQAITEYWLSLSDKDQEYMNSVISFQNLCSR